LAGDLLDAMQHNQADFTLTFRRLCDAAEGEEGDAGVGSLFANPREYQDWAARWRARLTRQAVEPRARAEQMRRVNPAFIPRNHRIEQVIRAAVDRQDFGPFEELATVLARPYQAQQIFESYGDPPQPGERVLRTFCGT
jgi:serine/tyrosine/threonine adenylyltransferase